MRACMRLCVCVCACVGVSVCETYRNLQRGGLHRCRERGDAGRVLDGRQHLRPVRFERGQNQRVRLQDLRLVQQHLRANHT